MRGGAGEQSPNEPRRTKWHRRSVSDRRNWLTVARKDVADAGRSWQVYVLGAVFTSAMVLGGVQPFLTAMAINVEHSTYSAQDGFISLSTFTAFIVPLAVLLFGHMAIAGELERGSLKTLLTFPVSRRNVVLGILLGRTIVVGTSLTVSLAIALVPMWLVYDELDLLGYAGISTAVIAFGVCFVAMAVGFSAAARTHGRALVLAVSAFGVTTFLWDILLVLARAVTGITVVTYNSEPDQAPGWFVFLDRVHPGTAWRHVVTEWITPVLSNVELGGSATEPTLTTPGPEPFYLDEWMLVLVLLAWAVVPLAIGYWRFRDAEVI